MPAVRNRIDLVAKYRRGEIPAKGKADNARNKKRNLTTRQLAKTPTRFHVENMPKGRCLLIPKVSSERRHYIPMGYMRSRVFVSDLAFLVPGAHRVPFGVLTSAMHMAWVRHVSGRLESRYRYSAKLVYNNYPWPESATEKRCAAVEAAAKLVLDVREEYLSQGSTLADLYDPIGYASKIGQTRTPPSIVPLTAATAVSPSRASGSG